VSSSFVVRRAENADIVVCQRARVKRHGSGDPTDVTLKEDRSHADDVSRFVFPTTAVSRDTARPGLAKKSRRFRVFCPSEKNPYRLFFES